MSTDIINIDKANIKDKIYTIRGNKVMLDVDLAEIYGYTTKAFNQQVKNNQEKFDEDFMFQLTREELFILRSNFLTANISSKSRSLPYVFTEQGIYMLMTVLKGKLATKQSKALIRLFKEMKDYLIENKNFLNDYNIARLAIQTSENTKRISEIEKNMITRGEFVKVINSLSKNINKEFLILNGKKTEAIMAYNDIYNLAKHTIYIIDNYISLKSLVLLKNISKTIKVIIFSDNINKSLHRLEYDDFKKEYGLNIAFKKTNNLYHDRYIIIDYGTSSEKIYHCGSSSKDAGTRITTITEIEEKEVYHSLINTLLSNDKLLLY